MVAKRRLTLLAAASMAAVVAAPALADVTSTVPVTVVGVGGNRMFYVEDLSGNALQGINLGTGGAQPFRTRVADTSFVPLASGGNYDVSATLSNLYLQNGQTYDYTKKVPSSAASINFGSNPLSMQGLSVTDLPKFAISGTLGQCLNLSSTLKSLLGLDALGNVVGTNVALSTLCTTLLTAALTTPAPVGATVPAAVQALTPALTNLADLPTALSGAVGGTFTNPSYDGIGAGDQVGLANNPPAATAVPLMTGTTAGSLSTALVNQITSLLSTPSPLAGTTGTPLADPSTIIAQLSSSASTVTSELGAVLNTISSANQVAAINEIFTTVAKVAPAIGDVQGVTGNSFAFPVLKALPSTPVPGTYSGTMTVTFVQH